ncbi:MULTISPECIES: hypothetical protein [unclassified Cupriavidus]|uniref:hypothetical protein n=1 Tax=unclassified Cupriavidus TaxID=2640874 RepID=UPI001C004EF7|nr:MULTISPECIES: hypothetical protein [unclassified Cupriavidus]MCA3188314.1 hypothetical protein [Cupriavidus sp.]MCA3189832.1 hypothetical protein [Cupriavidus sp.]MCA3196426.1 hypothetical protein [Cupriavidus sp.]MCA3202171.1 hypothetical protein [Cupriavidus sp.]QWE93310.1 hypothetical protein KLP38_09675 [Cupriavidus sp. EM10]
MTFITILCIIAGVLLFVAGLLGIGCLWAVKLGEDEFDEMQGYVDQDGETTPSRHQWVNAGAKAHHAD